MKARLLHVTIPMKNCFSHSSLKKSKAESLLLQIQSKDCFGLGECAPRMHVTSESIDSVIKNLLKINLQDAFNQINLSSENNAIKSLISLKLFQHLLSKRLFNVECIVELAFLDYIGNYFGSSISQILKKYFFTNTKDNKNSIKEFPTTQVMDFSLSPQEFLNKRRPFHYIKIKVGKDCRENIDRVSYIRKNISEKVPILVDANRAWSYKEAEKIILALKKYDISYFEDPLNEKDSKFYRQLRRTTETKILLDESICSMNDAKSALKLAACDALNIRIAKCGGILNSLKLIDFSRKNNLPYQLGAHVTEIGPLIAAGRNLSSILHDKFTFEAGQPDYHFYKANYIVEPMPLVDRKSNLACWVKGNGLGVSLNQNYRKNLYREYNYGNKKWFK